MSEIDLEKAIEESKRILNEGDNFLFSEYGPTYFFTTENIRAYLENNSFSKNRALSVLASGDQVFNLAYFGMKEIDTFDINILTYFTFWLKYAMILGLTYPEFLQADAHYCYLRKGELSPFLEMLKKIEKFLPGEVYYYFIRIIEYQEKYHPGHSLFYLYCDKTKYNRYYNLYASQPDAYSRTKNHLRDLSIDFHFGDLEEIPQKLKNHYDVILLSNIGDYRTKDGEETETTRRILTPYYYLLNPNGMIIDYTFQPNIFRNLNLQDMSVDSHYFSRIRQLPGAESYLYVRKKM